MAPSIIPKKSDTPDRSKTSFTHKNTETLSIGDGFRFGCGFFLAWLVLVMVVLPIIVVVSMMLTAAGISAIVP